MTDPRCPVADVARVLQLARDAGAWTDQHKSILFHDLDRLEGRLTDLRQAFPNNALHAVAMKANPIVKLLEVIVSTGAGL
ncbi:MAG: diaminopimelate decarboxylase, partial [Rhodobacterales bacterium]|nr:diaminopimelate decarboxylase [Rhodobacterales bacterium]